VWVDGRSVTHAVLPADADDAAMACVVTSVVETASAMVSMLIDARDPELRVGDVATYRLARASGLPATTPVAVYAPEAWMAWDAVDLLLRLDAKRGGSLGLLVAASREKGTCVVVAGLVGTSQHSSGAHFLKRDDVGGLKGADGPMALLRIMTPAATIRPTG
jgi:hypothetical protein